MEVWITYNDRKTRRAAKCERSLRKNDYFLQWLFLPFFKIFIMSLTSRGVTYDIFLTAT